MRNILMTVLTFLLIILLVVLMINGLKIGDFEVLSISQIIEKNDELTQKINEVKTLNDITYKKELSTLNTASKQLATSKATYLDIASVSSDDEIKKANQEQIYSMEYLWSQIGNHATEEGVTLKLEVNSTGVSNKNNLNFTVNGTYIGIRNFIYSLENDENLEFRIEGFKLTTGGSTTNSTTTVNTERLQCTFTVSDIGIKSETISSSVNNNSANKGTTNTTSNNTTTDNTKNNTISDTIDNTVQ